MSAFVRIRRGVTGGGLALLAMAIVVLGLPQRPRRVRFVASPDGRFLATVLRQDGRHVVRLSSREDEAATVAETPEEPELHWTLPETLSVSGGSARLLLSRIRFGRSVVRVESAP